MEDTQISLEQEKSLLRKEITKLRRSSITQDSQSVLDILESMGDGFIELSKDYKVLRVNKVQERISGLSRDQTVGRNHWDVWPKHIIPKIWEAYHKVIRENVAVRVEDFNTALRIWIEVDAYPTPSGGIAAFFRDVTEHKNSFSTLQSERERFKRLAAASGIGVWYSDLPFSELIWDDKMKEHFWLPADAKVSIDTFYERIHPQDRERTRQATETSIRSHTRYDIEFRTTNPKDESDIKWIRAIGWTDYDLSGTPIRFDGISLNVTARKTSEQALRESEDELRRTSEVLKTSVSDLEIERDLREKFVATLSHDLRTPITSAKLSLQLISRKAAGQEAIERLAGKSISALDRAADMIQDLLDANMIRAGQKLPLELSEFNLTKLASETIEELRIIHGDRIELNAADVIAGFWSRGGIRRVLENLVNNAAKYGAPDRPIRISLIKRSDQIKLCVHNEGASIPVEEQSKLFHPFHRNHSAQASAKKGWGLGLALVKGIAEAHGGRVELKSDESNGTSFSVVLPVDARSNYK